MMKKEKITIILLFILLLLLGGYIVYDKTLSNNNKNSNSENATTDNNVTNGVNNNESKTNNVVENSNNEEKTSNSESTSNNTSKEPTYTVNNLTAVYQNQEKDYYLTLWDDGTFSYNNILGNYYIEGNYIYLNHLFINNNGLESTKGKTTLTINSPTELYDKESNITLGKVNQPTNPGGDSDFYSIVKSLMK